MYVQLIFVDASPFPAVFKKLDLVTTLFSLGNRSN